MAHLIFISISFAKNDCDRGPLTGGDPQHPRSYSYYHMHRGSPHVSGPVRSQEGTPHGSGPPTDHMTLR